MNKYYIEFITWKEGMVTMPGIHRVLGETNIYRNRTDITKTIPKTTIDSVFLSFNESTVNTFLNEHVAACVVAIVVESNSETEAINLIDQYLGPIEVQKFVLVDENNIELIENFLGNTLNEYSPKS